jgi:hypothetical protein
MVHLLASGHRSGPTVIGQQVRDDDLQAGVVGVAPMHGRAQFRLVGHRAHRCSHRAAGSQQCRDQRLRRRLGLGRGVTPVARVPQRGLCPQVLEARVLGDDLGLDPGGMAQQQIALVARRQDSACEVNALWTVEAVIAKACQTSSA